MKAFLKFHIDNKNSFSRLVFGYFLLLLVYRVHSDTFLVYAVGQPMKGPELDYAFWLSHCTGFPHYIIQHYWASLFIDAAVVLFSVACLVSEKHRPVLCRLLILFFFIQRITIESYSCSHSKSMSAVFIALMPFCFKDEINFSLVTEFARYFLIYILLASAFYKLFNGALLHPTNFSVVLVNQHSDLATLNPAHICYRIASKLIAHPIWAAFSYILLFITQISFFTGIFTKKYDRILFVCLFLFAVTTYLIMRIYNFDITLLGLYLLYFPSQKIKQDAE